VSFLAPEFFFFLGLFFLGAALLNGRARLWFYTLMSYLFYSAAYPPHTLLLAVISLINYYTSQGLKYTDHTSTRRLILGFGVGASLALLGYFKYAHWFISTLFDLLPFMSVIPDLPIPNPTLPVGISFFTFQALSYTIDIYRRQIEPSPSLLEFTCFVSFFPQLVAGPIVRSREFMPQIPFHQPFKRDNTVRGLELILLGYFKKCVIADNLARTVDIIFISMNWSSGVIMWLDILRFQRVF
jgi:D-alanyl-lipoteichoic acid acyltransferase DltB (MBOAT superfamily)